MLGRIGFSALALLLSISAAQAQSSAGSNGSSGGSGGTVTANQGGTWTFGLSGPIPAGSAVIGAVTQSGGPWSVSGTVALSGALPAFASTPTVNLGTLNGIALDATLTARLGTLGQKAAAGSAPVVLASDQPAVPTTTSNGATAANQTSEIAQLTAANQRAAFYVDYGPGSLAATAVANNNAYDAGGTPSQYTKFNASYSSTQSITAVVQGSYDGASFFEVYTGTVPAPVSPAVYGGLVVSVPLTFRYYRTRLIGNATNAATVLVTHSLSTN